MPRGIRDDDDDDYTVTFDDVRAVAESAQALCVRMHGDDDTVWIPKSQITDDSEVYAPGHLGRLVITRWIAIQKGLV